jgi:hypothetical protein
VRGEERAAAFGAELEEVGEGGVGEGPRLRGGGRNIGAIGSAGSWRRWSCANGRRRGDVWSVVAGGSGRCHCHATPLAGTRSCSQAASEVERTCGSAVGLAGASIFYGPYCPFL